MQIVINIPEDVLKRTVFYREFRDLNDCITIIKALEKATPLPKGHGRLNGADIIKDFKNKVKHYGKDYRFTQEEILNILERYEIKYAPTTIDADKESGE